MFTPEYQLFLERFVAIRKAAGLTQAEVAARMNKPQSFISKCQTGERRVDIIELCNYCEATGVPFAEFARELEAALKQLDR